MISRGAFVSIKTVVGSHNFPSFVDTLYFAKNIGATQFLYSPLSITGAATRMRLLNKVTTRAINQKVVEAVERDPAIGPFIRSSPLARYLKVIYTKDPGILPRVQYHINHDGRISPQDNLYEFPDYHFGDISRKDYDFDSLRNFQVSLEQPIACQQCPVNYYCPRGDYANLTFKNEEGIGLTGEFAVCDEIRDNVYYLMTLGVRGIRLVEAILGK
ncbi:hypothetical protein [Cupriavidus necator]